MGTEETCAAQDWVWGPLRRSLDPSSPKTIPHTGVGSAPPAATSETLLAQVQVSMGSYKCREEMTEAVPGPSVRGSRYMVALAEPSPAPMG